MIPVPTIRAHVATALAVLLLALAVPQATAASSITVTITSPSNNAHYTRLDTIAFNATVESSGCGTPSYQWLFGDGTQATTQNATKKYATLGTFNVQLKVNAGSGQCQKNGNFVTVIIDNVAPVAALAAIGTPTAGASFALDASGSSDPDATPGSSLTYQFFVDGVSLGLPSGASSASASLTKAGPHTASVTVTDVNGASTTASRSFEVAPATVWSVAVELWPPNATVAGSGDHPYSFRAYDAYNNLVVSGTAGFPVPTTAGFYTVCRTVHGIEGCSPNQLQVLPDALFAIDIAGPAEIVVGTTGTFSLSGRDQHGNAVALAQSSLDVTAPTTVGTYEASYTESGVTGTAPYSAIADALFAIDIAGPAEIVVGATGTFFLSGRDQHGNAVALAQSSLDVTAPTTVGTYEVSYTQGGVTGSTTYDAVAGALASIRLTGPDSVPAGSSATYALAGFDGYGNSVPLAQASVDLDAPLTPGNVVVSYTEQGVTGSKTVDVVAVSLLVAVGAAQPVYDVATAVSGGVRVTVSVAFPGHGPIAGATVTLRAVGPDSLLGPLSDQTWTATAGEGGSVVFELPIGYGLPGEYRLFAGASAYGQTGSAEAAYTVGL